MAEIKKHLCKTCGAPLVMDEENQVFQCTFCGSMYEASDFFDDRALEQAFFSLNAGDFSTAIYSFNQVLTADETNPRALRGKVLACSGHSTLQALVDDQSLSFREFNPGPFVGIAPDEYKPYFQKYDVLADVNKELATVRSEIGALQSQYNQNQSSYNSYARRRGQNSGCGIFYFILAMYTVPIWFAPIFFIVSLINNPKIVTRNPSMTITSIILFAVIAYALITIRRAGTRKMRECKKNMEALLPQIQAKRVAEGIVVQKRMILTNDMINQDRVLFPKDNGIKQ
ncbi:MAG: hypothetical protein KBT07_06270 [Clostridiales bacterium]|nr:hypothetical protein [Candidatus Scatonaster coprocaballi]